MKGRKHVVTGRTWVQNARSEEGEKIMAKLAEIIGLSYADMVDITSWALYLVTFGVCFGKALYDLFGWFGDLMSSLFDHLFSFVARHFPNVRKKREE